MQHFSLGNTLVGLALLKYRLGKFPVYKHYLFLYYKYYCEGGNSILFLQTYRDLLLTPFTNLIALGYTEGKPV